MMIPAQPPSSEPAIDPRCDEAEQVFRHRRRCFRDLGFGDLEAELLADSDVDTHAAKRMIRERGCPVETAARILI